ncbi:MAG TPA: fasciclin domain-containing protein [Armatimonadota bacterium]|jgi:uncharacterized surface protein with fasciclin (FAS1) repeats
MANIVDTIFQLGKFNRLLTACKAAGVLVALRDTGPFTLFAPTDAAFENLPPGALENFLKNPHLLREMLAHHIIAGTVTVSGLKRSKERIIQTVGRETVTFDLSLFTGKLKVDYAAILQADIPADNGVVHIIDHVLMPGELRGQQASSVPIHEGRDIGEHVG